MSPNRPQEGFGKSDGKLAKTSDKLTKSLDSLTKATTSFSTVLTGTALAGAFKQIASAIPQATNKIVKELSSNISKLTSAMSSGVSQLKGSFRSLYLVLREGVLNIQSLFSTVTVHRGRIGPTGAAISPSSILRALTFGIAGGKATSPLGAGNFSTGRGGAGFVGATGQATDPTAEIRKLGRVFIINLNFVKEAVDEVVDEIQGLGSFLFGPLDDIRLTNSLNQTILRNINAQLGDVVSKINSLSGPLGMLASAVQGLPERIFGYFEEATQELGVMSENIESINLNTIEGFDQLLAQAVDAVSLLGTINKTTRDYGLFHAEFLQSIDENIKKMADKIVSPNSINVHVHDDMGIAALKDSQKQKSSGGIGLGGILKGIGIFSGAMTAFGGALNPGAILQLGMAFRDLAATVGVAFEPAIHVVTKGIRQIAAIILPAFIQLRPAISEIVQSFVRALLPVVRVVTDRFQLLITPIQFLAAIVDGLSTIFETIVTIGLTFQQVITEWVASFFDFDVKDALHSIVSNLQYVGQQLVLAVAYIAKKLGANAFVDRLVKNFEALTKPAKLGGAVAGGETSLKSLESVVKGMNEAAGRAGGFAGPSPEEEAKAREEERLRLAQETLDALKEIQKKGDTDKIPAELKSLLNDVIRFAKEGADVLEWIKNFIMALKNIGGVQDAKEGFNQGYTAGKNKSGRAATHSVLGELFADMGFSFGSTF